MPARLFVRTCGALGQIVRVEKSLLIYDREKWKRYRLRGIFENAWVDYRARVEDPPTRDWTHYRRIAGENRTVYKDLHEIIFAESNGPA
jgi:hypothetical protein